MRKICKLGQKIIKILVVGAVLLAMYSPPLHGKVITDQDITLAVKTELMNDESVPSHLVDVKTEEGIVTLSGSVDNILARDQATRLTQTVKGVRSVINGIEVKTGQRRDEYIGRDVKNALIYDPATDSYEVSLTVDDGVVNLVGWVESWHEKYLCEQVAKSVKGVTDVRNQIRVRPESDRPDIEIEKEIERYLALDMWVDEQFIDVSVSDGKVTLKGTAGSVAEKARAHTGARVAGVKSVDISALKVDWTAYNQMDRGSKYVPTSDEEIEQAVEDAFVYDPRVAIFDVEVAVEDGVVTLTGVVDNLRAKKAAAKDAWNTAGVLRVKNYINVRPEEMLEDVKILGRVKDAFLRDAVTERHEIDITVVNGKVFLYGTVDSRYERRQAEILASQVKGVVAVSNNLKVEAPDWFAQGKSDWEIKQDIESQLWWSPYVDAADVEVAVKNGVATLTGKVDSWGERRATRKNAYDGGALRVNNYLKVRKVWPRIIAK